jgi:hypothetical protein
MPVPDFSPGEVLTAAAMDSIGLWLVKTQTVGTGVSSVTVTGAFSADYDNYKILYTGGVGSAAAGVTLKMGSTTAGYYNQLIYATYAGVTVLANVSDNNNAIWSFIGTASTSFARLELEINNPYSALRTVIKGSYLDTTNSGNFSGYLDNATSYTAFTIAPQGATTLTGGTIRVYGYRN